ncbi:MAG: D-tyrosyl-tRNA(Tyr) deacylase [Pseudonocardiales bacterium]|nr:D-tyrosyl-tRNA(Tyr) deacylase [Pseudonocardiales bacterium]
MRVVAQRVTSAEVSVAGQVVGRLPPGGTPGLLVLIGVTHSDTPATSRRMADKTWTLRILDDEKSCADNAAPILVVSQFTLYADTRKGRRPSWNAAAPGAVSEPLVTAYVEALRLLGAHVETGIFGADMAVSLVNDGPMTILLDSQDFDRPRG